jgi:hypothetical protein
MENGESITGKEGEYKIISKLMNEGFPVYVPVLDVHGVDCVIKNKHGRLIEIQIKTRIEGDGYNKEFVIRREFTPHKDFFICCYLMDKDEFWFVPSFVFMQLCNKDNGCYTLTMNLDNERKLLQYRKERGFSTLNVEIA